MAGFYQRFLDSAEKWPSHIAVELQRQDGSLEQLSYAELRSQAEAMAFWLSQQGLLAGARCSILAANSPRWVAAYLGVIAAGHVAVPLDTAFNADQVAKLLRDSGSSILFADAKNLTTARGALQQLAGRPIQLVTVDGDRLTGKPHLSDILSSPAVQFAPVKPKDSDAAVILYTSGTTSDPKGVVLSHGNLLAESDCVFGFIKVGPTDSILGVLPLFHALAQMANLLLPFAAGARVVYLETLNTQELLRALREREITLFCCVPQFFYLIHERVMKEVKGRGAFQRAIFGTLLRLARAMRKIGLNIGKLAFRRVHALMGTKMRHLITGGSRFDAAIGRDLQALGFNLLQAYGLTETSGGAAATPPYDNVIGSVGKPLPGVEIRISDPEASEAGKPASGEILIRGGIVMQGYYRRPDATAAAIRDGWLDTGDLGYFDKKGNLFISGRKKEIIVLSSGKNIYPEEIESHYEQSPVIKEIAVLGVASKPGEPLSERLHAVVVPNFEFLRERNIVNVKEVIRFDIENLSAQLPASKRILSYDISQQELPRTTTRKLKRFEIQKQVAARQAEAIEPALKPTSPEESAWLAEAENARAVEIIRKAARNAPGPISPDASLELDLGFDSMERVELLVELEQAFGSDVDDAVASRLYTVRELVAAVRDGAGKSENRQAQGWETILAADSVDAEVRALVRPRPVPAMLWFLVSRLFRVIFRIFFRMQVRGAEKLPQGAFLICPNHQSFLDPAALISALPWRVFKNVFYVGTSEIFGQGLIRVMARSLNLVPVDPDANLVPAMRAGAYGLRRGKILVLYPEGERSITGEPKIFRKGAAILSVHLQTPIVPVAMEGFYEAWPRGLGFQKFTRLFIEFGDPIPPQPPGSNPEIIYEQVTRDLKGRVLEMWTPLHEKQSSPQPAAADG